MKRSGEIDVKAISPYGQKLDANSLTDPFSSEYINITVLKPNESQQLVKKFQNFYNENKRIESCAVKSLIRFFLFFFSQFINL